MKTKRDKEAGPRPMPEWFVRAMQDARIQDWWKRQPWYVRFYLECRRRLGFQPPKWVKID